MKVEVVTYQDWRQMNWQKEDVVVTVSKSDNWTRGLSPFVLGPCKLYDPFVSMNMENAWQFSKVYSEFLDGDNIKPEYWDWCKKGWGDKKAYRYPMGKGRIPSFSLWGEERLGYIEARKRIYIPLYFRAVKDTSSFKKLKEVYEEHKTFDRDLYLIDFDAYRHRMFNMSYNDVINCSSRKMGHAFVLAMALECPEELEKLEL